MATTVAARLQQGNAVPFRGEQRFISVRPVAFSGGRCRKRRRSRRAAGTEPSASIGKRLFDIAVASAALLSLAPFLIAIAIVIKLTSPGPVLFCQHRYGYRNRRFKIYKFRSMRVDVC